MAADAAAGFQAIKLKVGRRLEDGLAAVARAVTIPLRWDANMAWASTAEAARAMRALAGFARVECFNSRWGGGTWRGCGRCGSRRSCR